MKSFIIIALTIFLLYSCAEENPNLVNPPSQAETVNIRLLNFASDKIDRVLSVDGRLTQPTPYGQISPTIKPPLDSGFVSLLKSSSQEIRINRKLTFSRNLSYTFIAFPPPKGSSNTSAVDTMYFAQTSSTIPTNTSDAFIKFINAYPDSLTAYSLKLGCPSGEMLSLPLSYTTQSVSTAIRSGLVAVSLIKHTQSGELVVGLYQLNLVSRNQYLLIVNRDINDTESLLLVDQSDLSANALKAAEIIDQRNSFVRFINFSDEPLSLGNASGIEIVPQSAPLSISQFLPIATCESSQKDIFRLIDQNSNEVGTDSISLEVLRNYSVFAFKSTPTVSDRIFIAPPMPNMLRKPSESVIRVINAFPGSGVTMSIGARTDDSKPSKFRTGEILAAKLDFMKISEPVVVNSGYIPITIFTSSEPANFLSAGISEVQSGKDYTIVVMPDDNGKVKFSIIEETTENTSASYISAGVLTQIVNALPGAESIIIDLQNILQGAKLSFNESMATVIPSGSTQIFINEKARNINASPEERALLIATFRNDDIDVIGLVSPPIPSVNTLLKRRFINASGETKFLTVHENPDDTSRAAIVEYVPYGVSTGIYEFNRENKISLYFLNSETNEVINRVDDLFQTFGTSYTFIFTSRKNADTTVIIQQEF